MTYWSLTEAEAPTFLHRMRLGSQETCLPSCIPFRISTSSSAIVKSNTYRDADMVTNRSVVKSIAVISTGQDSFKFKADFFLYFSFWNFLPFIIDKYSIKLTCFTGSFAPSTIHFYL